jgi:hypothetical protein
MYMRRFFDARMQFQSLFVYLERTYPESARVGMCNRLIRQGGDGDPLRTTDFSGWSLADVNLFILAHQLGALNSCIRSGKVMQLREVFPVDRELISEIEQALMTQRAQVTLLFDQLNDPAQTFDHELARQLPVLPSGFAHMRDHMGQSWRRADLLWLLQRLDDGPTVASDTEQRYLLALLVMHSRNLAAKVPLNRARTHFEEQQLAFDNMLREWVRDLLGSARWADTYRLLDPRLAEHVHFCLCNRLYVTEVDEAMEQELVVLGGAYVLLTYVDSSEIYGPDSSSYGQRTSVRLNRGVTVIEIRPQVGPPSASMGFIVGFRSASRPGFVSGHDGDAWNELPDAFEMHAMSERIVIVIGQVTFARIAGVEVFGGQVIQEDAMSVTMQDCELRIVNGNEFAVNIILS